MRVARDFGGQPRGLGIGTDEDEEATAVMPAHHSASLADVDGS